MEKEIDKSKTIVKLGKYKYIKFIYEVPQHLEKQAKKRNP